MKALWICLILIPLVVFCGGCASPAKMDGESMLPTLKNGDRLFISSSVSDIKRGDIVMFRYPKDESKFFLKRVIGLPGEKIEVRENKVFINGEVLEEPYLDQKFNTDDHNSSAVVLPENRYFVMGDNRDNSSDSRIWGTVEKKLITGKYLSTYYSAEKK